MIVMDMGYDDSNNVFSKNLGIFNYFLYTVQKIEFEGRFLYKIPHAGPVCAGAWCAQLLFFPSRKVKNTSIFYFHCFCVHYCHIELGHA